METPLGQAVWRKSTYSGQAQNCVEVAAWRKSSYSAGQGSCVEVADGLPGGVAVRDTKDPHGPALVFGPAAWRALARRVRNGELGLAASGSAP